jgi:leader peptidase (prepilin peptidase)/N-methyltransferase
MGIMIGFIVFIIGLAVGSFLNVCIYRIPIHESVVTGPSHCPQCGTRIKWYDLVPVLSYVLLKGRCRSCKTPISIRYPIIELLNGSLWLFLYHIFGLSGIFVLLSIISSTIVVFLFILHDLWKKIIK